MDLHLIRKGEETLMAEIEVYYRLIKQENGPDEAELVCLPDEDEGEVFTCTLPLIVVEDDWGEIRCALELPESIDGHPLTKIGENALDDNDISMDEAYSDDYRSMIASVTLPENIKCIHPDAFEWLVSLRKIWVHAENLVYESVDGVLYDREKSSLVRCPVLWEQDRFIVREGTLEIAPNAFGKCENLICVLLPDGLETLGDSAFYNCAALEYVYLPDSLRTMGEGCFYRCTDLPYLRVPQNVESIGKHAFEECVNLRGISLPNTYSLRKIGSAAFKGCISLRAIVLPLGLTAIDSSCFEGCWALEEVCWPEIPAGIQGQKALCGLQSIGYGAFSECERLREIALPQGLRSIGQYAFDRCKGLKKIHLPASLEKIVPGSAGNAVNGMPFGGCTALEEITIAEGNVHFAIHDGALVGLDDSRIICFPPARKQKRFVAADGICEIDMDAFQGQQTLEEVVLPDGLKSIGSGAFRDCTALRSIHLPKGLGKLGAEAFCGCSALKGVALPEGIKDISSGLFSGCTALEEIVLPEGIVEIGASAFENCSALRRAVLPRSLCKIHLLATLFKGCSSVVLHIPRNSYAQRCFEGTYWVTQLY